MRRRRRQVALTAAGIALAAAAQAGPFEEAGYDPALMAAWATSVVELVRGPMDITQPGAGDASYGSGLDALGPPGVDTTLEVVSLGDGGHVTLHFASGIGDGPGDDFAVYENGIWDFDELFAELAFVEVSTDGVDFERFDSIALATEPVPGGGTIDPSDYHNLGGKHEQGWGTGFDLAELGLASAHYVRLVDVVGADDPSYARLDSQGAKIYDPFTTPFTTGGFDLDAVGVLHTAPEPGAFAGQLAGLLALGALARRRREGRCGRGG